MSQSGFKTFNFIIQCFLINCANVADAHNEFVFYQMFT